MERKWTGSAASLAPRAGDLHALWPLLAAQAGRQAPSEHLRLNVVIDGCESFLLVAFRDTTIRSFAEQIEAELGADSPQRVAAVYRNGFRVPLDYLISEVFADDEVVRVRLGAEAPAAQPHKRPKLSTAAARTDSPQRLCAPTTEAAGEAAAVSGRGGAQSGKASPVPSAPPTGERLQRRKGEPAYAETTGQAAASPAKGQRQKAGRKPAARTGAEEVGTVQRAEPLPVAEKEAAKPAQARPPAPAPAAREAAPPAPAPKKVPDAPAPPKNTGEAPGQPSLPPKNAAEASVAAKKTADAPSQPPIQSKKSDTPAQPSLHPKKVSETPAHPPTASKKASDAPLPPKKAAEAPARPPLPPKKAPDAPAKPAREAKPKAALPAEETDEEHFFQTLIEKDVRERPKAAAPRPKSPHSKAAKANSASIDDYSEAATPPSPKSAGSSADERSAGESE